MLSKTTYKFKVLEKSKNLNRLGGVDLFRIVSAIVVWMFHSIINNGCEYGILNSFLSVGAVFMTGFFCASGYVLFYTYSENDLQRIQEIKRFYQKRLIAIVPAYYITAILYLIFRNTEPLKNVIILAPIEILGIQSVFSSLFSISHNSGTWFISCLLICYLLFPFMCSLSKQMKLKHRCILMLFLIGILLYSPIVVQRFSLSRIYTNPFFRGCEFFIGVLLCASYNEIREYALIKRIFLNGYAVIAEGILLILGINVIMNLGIAGDYMSYSLVALPVFILQLAALTEMPFEKFSNSKFITYVSSLCYAFFLGQSFSTPIVLKLTDRGLLNNNLFRIIVFFILTSIFAVAIHELIEKPSKKVIGNWIKMK